MIQKFIAWVRSFFRQRDHRSEFSRNLSYSNNGILPKFNFPDVLPKFKLSIGEFIAITPGKRHAWYASNVGPVRKPL